MSNKEENIEGFIAIKCPHCGKTTDYSFSKEDNLHGELVAALSNALNIGTKELDKIKSLVKEAVSKYRS